MHGIFHGAWVWTPVVERLAAAGRVVAAVDLLGHGLDARRPRSVSARPFDAGAFAAERSPAADLQIDAMSEHLARQVAVIGGGEPVVLVSHSNSSAVVNRVAQEHPGSIAHLVHVSAFLLPSGKDLQHVLAMPEARESLLLQVAVGDPAAIGAIRIDPASPDPGDAAALREALYGDLPVTTADACLALLSPDAPAALSSARTTVTADGFGSVPRTYVVCTSDRAVPPALQRRMVEATDAAFPQHATRVVELDASHAAMLSRPDDLARIIDGAG